MILATDSPDSLCVILRLFSYVGPIALASFQELSKLFGAVENSGSNSKEPDASGLAGAKKADAGDA